MSTPKGMRKVYVHHAGDAGVGTLRISLPSNEALSDALVQKEATEIWNLLEDLLPVRTLVALCELAAT